MHISRRWFELCAITEVMRGLKSGDICIPGSDRHSDFREQFVSEEECFQNLASYGERSGVPTEPKAFVARLARQAWKKRRAKQIKGRRLPPKDQIAEASFLGCSL